MDSGGPGLRRPAGGLTVATRSKSLWSGGPVLVKTGKLSAAAALYTVDRSGFVFERVDALTKYGRFH
jgi:hypothetical protein